MGDSLTYGLFLNNHGITIDFYKKVYGIPNGKAIEERQESYDLGLDNKLFHSNFINTLIFIPDMTEPFSDVNGNNVKTISNQRKDTIVYETVDESPVFSIQSFNYLQKWILDCLWHSDYDLVMGNKLMCSFIVELDGSISNIEVAIPEQTPKGKAIIKIPKNMPRWEPGKKNGIPVRTKRFLPIIFGRDY